MVDLSVIDDALLEKVMKRMLSRGGDYADIFVEHKTTTAIQLEDGKIEKVLYGSQAGIGIRLIYDRKTAYAYSNDFSEAVLMDLAHSVGRAAAARANDVVINVTRRQPDISFSIKKPPETIPVSLKVDLVRKGDVTARKTDGRIKQVTVVYRDSRQRVKILRSDSFLAEDDRVYTTGLVHVIAVDGGTIQTGYEAVGGLIGFELFEDNPIDLVASVAARRSVLMLKARRAPGGRMPVVISSEAGGTMIHEAIGHGLEADLAQQGLSVYSNKLGERVASPVVSVIDDATLSNKRGSFCFDDEGTPSQRKILVRDGILEGYLYDAFTALVDGTRSTGNGRRESYEYKPVPRMTNTFIAPGTLPPDEVIRSVPAGLLVKKMGGGQVNTVTGDFVFEVQEGYLIENGMVGEAVRGATLIGSGPEVLTSIDLVASDLGFSIGTCGKDGQGVPVSDAMPTLRIPEMVVGGEVH